MSNSSIVVVGSSNTDMTIRLDRLPGPGETVLGGEFVTAAGGKGANQAVAAARAGARVTFVARLGSDLFGDQAVENYVKEGIDIRHVVRDKHSPSGVALIFVDRRGENCIAVASGANAHLSPDDVANAYSSIAAASVLLIQLETPLPTVLAAVTLANEAGIPVILNPAPAQELPEGLLERIAILTPNEHEAGLLSGIAITDTSDAKRAAQTLLDKGVETVVITLGERGALVASHEGLQLLPTSVVKAIDTVAAGDVFNGAFAVALTERRPIAEAVRFANAAAAISVTRAGAQPSAPTRQEIERQFARDY